MKKTFNGSLYLTNEKNELIIHRGNRYYNHNQHKNVSSFSLFYKKLENELYIALLEELANKWLDYMILWFNDNEVITRNFKASPRWKDWKKISSNFIWRTRWVWRILFERVSGLVLKQHSITKWTWENFNMFMTFCLKEWLIINKDETKKYVSYKNKWWMSPKLIWERNLFIKFLEKVQRLSMSFDDIDNEELQSIQNRYDMDRLYDMIFLYNNNKEEFNKKISCIWGEKKYILKDFTIKKQIWN